MKVLFAVPASYTSSRFVRDFGIKYEFNGLRAGHSNECHNIYIMAESSEKLHLESDGELPDRLVMGSVYRPANISNNKGDLLKNLQITGISKGMVATEAEKFTQKQIDKLGELIKTQEVEILFLV